MEDDMPRFRNPSDKDTITMQFGGDPPIIIRPLCEAEVADRWAALVKSRGYRVEEVPSDAPTTQPEAQAPPPPPAFDLDALLARIAAATTIEELSATRDEYAAAVKAGSVTREQQRTVQVAGEAAYDALRAAMQGAEPATEQQADAGTADAATDAQAPAEGTADPEPTEAAGDTTTKPTRSRSRSK